MAKTKEQIHEWNRRAYYKDIEKSRAKARASYYKHKDKWLARHRKKRYDLTDEELQELIKLQNNCCLICEKEFEGSRGMHVDHSHTKGHVRGLLCNHCNPGLGHFRDNSELLIKAIDYLKEREIMGGYSYQELDTKLKQYEDMLSFVMSVLRMTANVPTGLIDQDGKPSYQKREGNLLEWYQLSKQMPTIKESDQDNG